MDRRRHCRSPADRLREGEVPSLAPYLQPVLAHDRVRYVGEPVAVVFAEDAYLAEDAAELVGLEIEHLPVVVDAQDLASIEADVIRKGYGDVDAAFGAAHAGRRARSCGRAPFGRPAGDTRRARTI